MSNETSIQAEMSQCQWKQGDECFVRIEGEPYPATVMNVDIPTRRLECLLPDGTSRWFYMEQVWKEPKESVLYFVFCKLDKACGGKPTDEYPVIMERGAVYTVGSIVTSPRHIPYDRLSDVLADCWSKRWVREVIIRRVPEHPEYA